MNVAHTLSFQTNRRYTKYFTESLHLYDCFLDNSPLVMNLFYMDFYLQWKSCCQMLNIDFVLGICITISGRSILEKKFKDLI